MLRGCRKLYLSYGYLFHGTDRNIFLKRVCRTVWHCRLFRRKSKRRFGESLGGNSYGNFAAAVFSRYHGKKLAAEKLFGGGLELVVIGAVAAVKTDQTSRAAYLDCYTVPSVCHKGSLGIVSGDV